MPKERCLTGCKQQTLSNTAWTWTDIYYFTQLQHVLLSAPFCSGSLKLKNKTFSTSLQFCRTDSSSASVSKQFIMNVPSADF